MGHINEMLKELPRADSVMELLEGTSVYGETQRPIVLDCVRTVIDNMRAGILAGKTVDVTELAAAKETLTLLDKTDKPSLRRVINATGIVLHTNLGRARLPKSAASAAMNVAMSYSTLEYDVETGERGSRHDHVSSIIAKITGAEAAMVVNNNAAATLLCLMALCPGKDVVVSRGELVEIGGSFRVPDIMETGGAILKEVGTTNKTHIWDYEKAIGENTGAILKVHTSNYKIMGFTEDVSVKTLSDLAHRNGLPMIYDLGSGLLVDLHEFGLDEPTVPASLAEGADVVLFSGDKLLGGPQAGIIVGKSVYIDVMKKHAFARAARVDKMTLAALEQTFRIYRDKKQALSDIPVLSMITADEATLRERADAMAARLRTACGNARFGVNEGVGRVGGGSAPMLSLKTYSLSVVPDNLSVNELEEKLRACSVPVIAHISDGQLLLDMRTVSPEELPLMESQLLDILS